MKKLLLVPLMFTLPLLAAPGSETFHCQATNFVPLSGGAPLSKKVDYVPSAKNEIKLDLDGVTATFRTFDNNGVLRTVLDLRGRTGEGKIAYSNVVVDGGLPPNVALQVTVPSTEESQFVIGRIACRQAE